MFAYWRDKHGGYIHITFWNTDLGMPHLYERVSESVYYTWKEQREYRAQAERAYFAQFAG